MHTSRFFLFALTLVGTLVPASKPSATEVPTIETLVFVRHAEKPENVDNGQLTCQGENRAESLADVLLTKYGKPDYLFAATPDKKTDNNGVDYWYLRALATLEPTAVAAGVTVDLNYDKDSIDDLEKELESAKYASSRVFIAWEHTQLDTLVSNIVHDNGGTSLVPAWPDSDYDSIFIVTLTRSSTGTVVTFDHDQEDLNDQSTVCKSQSESIRRPPIQLPPVPIR